MDKKLILFPLLILLIPLTVSASSCTDLVNQNKNEYYYPDEDYGNSAHAYAKIEISKIFGEDCTDNPYKSYAKVRVKCKGYSRVSNGPLYLYRLSPNADWSDAYKKIKCNKWGCVNYDRYFSSGIHTITLRNKKGKMDSAFFVCYDYDKSTSGYWAWAWTGWGYWGDRSVFKPRVERKCSNNDVYWYDSLGRKGEKYEECGSDSCNSWGEKFCSNNQVKATRDCIKKGCSGGSCYSRYEKKTKVIENCNYKCVSGECVYDTDKDGIYNKNDKCPKTGDLGYGLKNNGCPNRDSDKDGVIDRGDNCPNEGGSGSNGCPNFIEKIVHILFGWAGFGGWTM